jgi:glycosyltransferase involved in cell wall biosynthesis
MIPDCPTCFTSTHEMNGMTKTARQAIIVLGMHRSGTSALAGALGLLGARLPVRQLPPQPDNPKGYSESEQITAIHERLLAAAGTSWFSLQRIPDEWFRSAQAASFADELVAAVREDYGDAPLFVVKDPRMCRLLPIWRSVLGRIDAQACFAIALRNPFEVARSLEKRDGFPLALSSLLWLQYVIEAERETRGQPRIFKSYDELLNDPVHTAEDVVAQLGIEGLVKKENSAREINSFIEVAMRHHHSKRNELDHSVAFYPWLKETYQALDDLSRNPADEAAQRRLDDVRALFEPAAASFAPLLATEDKTLADLRIRAATLEEALTERENRIAALDRVLAAQKLEAIGSANTSPARIKQIAPLNETPKPILIIIPLYRNAQLIGPLVRSLMQCVDELQEIQARLLFINDSPDDVSLAEALREELPALQNILPTGLAANATNEGFIVSVNSGVAAAISEFRDVILLNSDIELFPGALREIRDVAYLDHMIGFVSPRSNNATICSLPQQSEYRHLPPARSYEIFQVLTGRLPRLTYVPTVTGFCLFIKFAILKEFGGFDPIYGLGYNEENDLIMRANRCGYRAALANRAFVYHVGEQSFSLNSAPRSTRDAENRKILDQRYPEYTTAISRYFASTEYRAESLITGLLAVKGGKLRIAFDCTNIGEYYSGTSEASRRIIEKAVRDWTDAFEIEILCEHGTFRFHKFNRLSKVRRADAWEDRRYAAIIRIGQPFTWDSFFAIGGKAPVIILIMLDTIALDCIYIDQSYLKSLWNFALTHTSGIIYQSQYTQRQFNLRFDIPKDVIQTVSMHSVDVRDYFDSGTAVNLVRDHILVVGNHYKHKFVEEAVRALREQKPTRPIVVLGMELANEPTIRSYRAGEIKETVVEDLYRRASVVLFPSHYEGFGFPILHSLACRKPVVVRRMPAFDEIIEAIGGSRNIHVGETITELVRLAASDDIAWRDEPAKATTAHDWSQSAAEIRQFLEMALGQFSFTRLTDRLEAIALTEKPVQRILPTDKLHIAAGELADLAERLIRRWPIIRSVVRPFRRPLRALWIAVRRL